MITGESSVDEFKELVEFCRTDRQREIFGRLAAGVSQRQLARDLGLSKGTISGIVRVVRDYSVLKGVSPEHDMVHACPDPYVVKGVSTLYNSEGRPVSQWVKTTLDQDRVRVLQEAMSSEFARSLPRYVPAGGVSSKKDEFQKMLAVVPIADAHIGMLSWKPETGNDYDVSIAEDTLKKTVSSLIDRTPACEECLIANLGDLLHADNQVGVTERSGNVLDMDGRYAKILQAGIRTIRYVIEYALVKHKTVTVINCCGNHDDLGSLWLSAALKNIYENERRLTVVDSPAPRHYYRYGSVLIGVTHGQDIKAGNLPLVMAAERQKDWGETEFHHWMIGHIHHAALSEAGGCTVEAFRAVCAKDAWTNSKGFVSGRDMKAILYDREFGEVERHIVAIRK